jgi:hypothetical protein
LQPLRQSEFASSKLKIVRFFVEKIHGKQQTELESNQNKPTRLE